MKSSAIRPNRRSANELAAAFARSGSDRFAPAVSESGVVADFDEGRVALPELASDALDCRADIRSIPMFPTPGDETLVVQAVVDGALGHVATGIRRQQMDDVVFAKRQPDIELIPIGAADAGAKGQPATGQKFFRQWLGARNAATFDDAPQAAGQYLHTARLVDEVEGATVESQALIVGKGTPRQEHHRQVHAVTAQLRQEVDAGRLGQAPVEHDDVGVSGDLERIEERGAVGKVPNAEPERFEFLSQDFAVGFVVVDE